MSTVRVIKRYANRKLYDTQRSRYITLEEIGALLRSGEEVRIVDNRTKEDLTSVTMAQVLVEEEKRNRRNGPLLTMRNLLGQSGELLQRRIAEPVQTWIDQNTLALEEIQARLDERIKYVLGHVALLTHLQRELSALRERLERVEAALGITPAPDEPPAPPDDEAGPPQPR